MAARTTPGNKRQQPQLPTVDIEIDEELNQTMEIAPPAKKPALVRTKATVRPVVQDPDTFTFTDAVSEKTPYRYLDLTSKTKFPNMFLKSCFNPSKEQLASIVGHVILSGEVVDELAWAKKHSETQVPYPYVVAVTNKKTKTGNIICLSMHPWMTQEEVAYESARSRELKQRDKAEYAANEVATVVSDDISAFGF